MRGLAAAMGLSVALMAPAFAQTADGPPGWIYPSPATEARVADLDWMVGSWRGEVGGSPVDEHWSPAAGGSMIGMFRWMGDDGPVLYEFFSIEEAPEGVVLHLRHFEPGLRGWEEKDAPMRLDLVEIGPAEATFRERGNPYLTLRYRADGENGLHAVLEKREGDEPEVHEFHYRRAER